MLSNTKKLTLNQAVERIAFCEENIERINMFFKSLESEGKDFKLDLVMMKNPIMTRDEEYQLNSLLSKIIVFELDKIATNLERALHTLTNNSQVTKYEFSFMDEGETINSSIQNHVQSLSEKELLDVLSLSRHLSYIADFTSDFVLRNSISTKVEDRNKKGLFSSFSKMLKKDNLNTSYNVSLIGSSRLEWEGYSICEAIKTSIETYKEAIVKQIHSIGYTV